MSKSSVFESVTKVTNILDEEVSKFALTNAAKMPMDSKGYVEYISSATGLTTLFVAVITSAYFQNNPTVKASRGVHGGLLRRTPENDKPKEPKQKKEPKTKKVARAAAPVTAVTATSTTPAVAATIAVPTVPEVVQAAQAEVTEVVEAIQEAAPEVVTVVEPSITQQVVDIDLGRDTIESDIDWDMT